MQILQDLLPPSIKIDWAAYYNTQFKPLHGGNPVEHEGRILFADGWGYSLTDIKGPEYPPPSDPWEHHWLKVAYWRKRKVLAEKILQSVNHTLQQLEDLERSRCVPIQVQVRVKNLKTRLLEVTHKGDLDLETYRGRIRQLKQDVEDSTATLAELGEYNGKHV